MNVTRDDVANAKKANSKHCALARSSLRIPGVVAAYFFRSMAFLEHKDKIVRFLLPQSVQKEIVSFDRAGIFADGIYRLRPPSPSLTIKNVRLRLSEARKKKQQARLAEIRSDLAKLEMGKAGIRSDADFERQVADVVSRHVGDRTVAGIRGREAPQPLSTKSPKARYVHRTKYVRDLREPTD